jgi:Uma2 family endonuclease
MTLMPPPSPPVRVTPDDLLELENEGLFELVDGKLIEKTMSYLSNKTAALIVFALQSYANKHGGDVLPEQSFQCFADDPELIRRPDIAFIASGRTPSPLPTGHVKTVPDVAVEVVSPSDSIYELDEKLDDYRSAGVKLVWVVNPNSRTIRIHRPDHSVTELTDSDTITGESVLPEFAVAVRDVLPAKQSQSS